MSLNCILSKVIVYGYIYFPLLYYIGTNKKKKNIV